MKEKQDRLNQLVNTIEAKKQRIQTEMKKDKDMSNLNQTKDIVLMGELEKIRAEETRVKRALDDHQNMKKGEEKSQERKNQMMAERISASEIPFYQRIIQKDHDNQSKKWNSNQRR